MNRTTVPNKTITRNITCTVLISVTIALTAYLFSSFSDSGKTKDERPLVSSMTVSPDIPAAVTFCGTTVDLTRYQTHEAFDRELSSFIYFHSTTLLLIKRANRYFPVIEPILKKQGIPDDFKYLAVIESHLDPRISSPARAVGMWQLLESTGRQYGLTINATVDERCNVEKATVAACKYLREAYNKYNDWKSVAVAYNAGMGRISSEMAQQKTGDILDLWLVEETSRYAYRIMAIKQIFENPYRYGFVLTTRNLYKPIRSKGLSVSTDIADLAQLAISHNITYADLKRFNPWLRDRKLITGGKTFTIQIPEGDDLFYNRPNAYVHDPRWVVN